MIWSSPTSICGLSKIKGEHVLLFNLKLTEQNTLFSGIVANLTGFECSNRFWGLGCNTFILRHSQVSVQRWSHNSVLLCTALKAWIYHTSKSVLNSCFIMWHNGRTVGSHWKVPWIGHLEATIFLCGICISSLWVLWLLVGFSPTGDSKWFEWLSVCVSLLALQQTGDLSRIYPVCRPSLVY